MKVAFSKFELLCVICLACVAGGCAAEKVNFSAERIEFSRKVPGVVEGALPSNSILSH